MDNKGLPSSATKQSLAYLSLSQDDSSRYEQRLIKEFGQRHHVPVQYLPSGGDTVNHQLELYREIFRHHYTQPDILTLDTIWPASLADDLVDLKPYLAEAIAASSAEQIKNVTVRGRVVAIPFSMDYGVLYYRPSLLAKYGFAHPPTTWIELEHMARTIQDGERRNGKRDFWGYGWSGGSNEALTCGALEWFLSASGSNFVEPDGSVHIDNAANIQALERAQSWIGNISPTGVALYHESDIEDLWRSGQAAFVRGWLNTFSLLDKQVGNDRLPFELASLPAGTHGHFAVLGDVSLGVSKYSANQELAIEALRELTSVSVQRQRLLQFGVMPTRTALFADPDTFRLTRLRTAWAQQSLATLAARPSTLLGSKYEAVSNDVSTTINSVLQHQQTAKAALTGLQERLERLQANTPRS